FNIESYKEQHDKLTLSVFDISGRLCYKPNGLFAQKTIERIELTNLPEGFYIVNIQGNNLSFNKKIIIKN
ncbi:MAG: T9SS type A sorting domain-containing protein, partial [Bacteroidales bacterium]|nr:T9SS type A sorting domain-containing protein [Bacteroidales bacterium]